MVGFKYGSYFNQQFTKCLGISPSEFRKNPTGYSMFEGDKVKNSSLISYSYFGNTNGEFFNNAAITDLYLAVP